MARIPPDTKEAQLQDAHASACSVPLCRDTQDMKNFQCAKLAEGTLGTLVPPEPQLRPNSWVIALGALDLFPYAVSPCELHNLLSYDYAQCKSTWLLSLVALLVF